MTSPRTVLFAGASGLIGGALVKHFTAQGDLVRRLVRRPTSVPGQFTWDPASGSLDTDALADVDIVVNLAGAPIGRRWTSSYKRTILESRTHSANLLASAVAELRSPPVLLQASAIGFYGDQGERVLTEDSPRGPGFLAGVVADWEAATAPAVAAGVRVAHLRTGIVLSPEGGALTPLLRLLKLGLGGPLGSGDQIWSWITLADHVAAVEHLTTTPVHGPVNLTSPNPATNRDLTKALAKELRRPALIRAPAFAIRAVLGEFSSEILGSQNVLPERLVGSGFQFSQPDLATAAHWVRRS